VIPVVNAFGFLNRSRYLPDRRDLNRCFPGSPGGALGSRLAHIFLNDVVLRCDFGIDLHSAAIHRTNLPQVRVSPSDKITNKMALDFGAPVVLTSPLRDGSLRAVAAEHGTPVVLYEAGEGLRFDEMAVRAGLAGILRVMRGADMLPAKGIARAQARPYICSASRWLRAPAGGLLRTFRAEGEVVEEGDVLATVSDPFGTTDHDLLAPSGGILIGRAILPVVNEGDAIFHLAALSPKAADDTVEGLALQLESDPLFDEDEII
jgi:predicted deacylase